MGTASAPSGKAQVTFDDDVAFLRRHGEVVVLTGDGGGRIAISARFQGRVMTSTVGAEGGGAASLGWIHRSFIEAGKTGTAFDNFGGEDRFWLGPEGGPFGLYFPPGAPFSFEAWQTPRELQEGPWDVVDAGPAHRTFRRTMSVVNHRGTPFKVEVTRTVRLLDATAVKARLGAPIPTGVRHVAYETENRIKNVGDKAWTPEGGLLSVWILGMFAPAADARIVVPLGAGKGAVNDAYFGKVPAERLVEVEGAGFLVFKADGHLRSKIGVGPSRARPWAGSYSAGAGLLTLVNLDLPSPPDPRRRYVNSLWEDQKEPYAGDVINAYNDGPVAPGKPSLGGFYELETSSPAAELAPGQTLVHTHRTFHLEGPEAGLDVLAQKTLGPALADVRRALP